MYILDEGAEIQAPSSKQTASLQHHREAFQAAVKCTDSGAIHPGGTSVATALLSSLWPQAHWRTSLCFSLTIKVDNYDECIWLSVTVKRIINKNRTDYNYNRGLVELLKRLNELTHVMYLELCQQYKCWHWSCWKAWSQVPQSQGDQWEQREPRRGKHWEAKTDAIKSPERTHFIHAWTLQQNLTPTCL